MRQYDYTSVYASLFTPDIVRMVGQIHEYKGEQNLFIEAKADMLSKLLDMAKIQSAEASNSIEGIYTSNERLEQLVKEKTVPRAKNEQEIAGYRDVLSAICESHDFIPLKPSIILQLHRDLYRFSSTSVGGVYKTTDSKIEEAYIRGNKSDFFQPVPAWETPKAIEQACQAYNSALDCGEYDPLLLIPIFILDFLCIHPFNDGNGRMSRLLTLLLLYRAGYIVGKYISMEKLIEKAKEIYYDTLQESSTGWHEGANTYVPFTRYLLGVVLTAYREFSNRVQPLITGDLSKPERIREAIRGTLGSTTKAELMRQCPDISQVTVQRALNDMVKSGEIIKLSGGRYTSYIWNREREI